MLLSWHLEPCLILMWLCLSKALCPTTCICKQTDKGNRKVFCGQGGMTDPMPTKEMDPGMQVLEITAPQGNPNTLSITHIFQHFKHLEELRIHHANIQQISMHAFWGVPSLKILDLSCNNLTTVIDHYFRGLMNLVDLNLDDNRIGLLQSGAFKHLTELRILTLQRNLISELVPRIFLKLAKLHVLKLSGNTFEELYPEVFKDIPDLRVLECRNCGLSRINTQIYHLLPYLSHLDLGNNQIQFIASDEFWDLHRLHSLKLDGNLLPVVLEKTFIHQQQLKYLCLARNRLAKITDTAFVNLTNLIELDIGYNKLRKLDGVVVQHTPNLQRLVISGNNFNVDIIKNLLQTLQKLWSLDIAQMRFATFPDFLPDRLKVLNISKNNFSEIIPDFIPKRLVELDITKNNLKGLNETVIIKLEHLKFVNLIENPWTCNLCHITPILFRMNRTSLFKNITCASPKSLKGKLLVSLRLEDLASCKDLKDDGSNEAMSDSKLGLIIGSCCMALFAFVAVIFVVCSCMKRRTRNIVEEEKRAAECRDNSLENPTAIFCKGEISFKFPLDLTERKMSVSTIDEIKKDTQLQTLPNGTGI